MSTLEKMTTEAFLNSIPSETSAAILEHIAHRYGITTKEAFEEVTDPEAENLLDYLTGSVRAATHVLIQRVNARNTAA